MEDFYEHIDEYIDGTLSGGTLEQFESALKQNESLRLAVENYNAAKSISEGLLEVDMLETLQGISKGEEVPNSQDSDNLNDQNNKTIDRSLAETDRSATQSSRSSLNESKTKVKRFDFRKLAVAASVIGILGLCTWWVITNNAQQAHIDYVLANYIEPVDEDATKSVDTTGMSPFQKGKHIFGLNRFVESEEWFLLALDNEKDKTFQSLGHYWLGCAYIEQRKLEDAERAWRASEDERARESLELLVDGKEE